MSDIHNIQHKPVIRQNCGVGFESDEITSTIDFDFASLDHDTAADLKAEMAKQSAQAVAKFSRQLLTIGGRNPKQFFIAANCLAFAAHIHPNQDQSGESIALSIGMNKAAFFRRVNQWRDILRLPRIAGAWGKEGRKTISAKTKSTHEKRISQQPTIKRGLIARLNQAHPAA